MDLRWCGAILYKNAVIEETGLAAAVLNHPANGISWIAKRFAPHGVALEPGRFYCQVRLLRLFQLKRVIRFMLTTVH